MPRPHPRFCASWASSRIRSSTMVANFCSFLGWAFRTVIANGRLRLSGAAELADERSVSRHGAERFPAGHHPDRPTCYQRPGPRRRVVSSGGPTRRALDPPEEVLSSAVCAPSPPARPHVRPPGGCGACCTSGQARRPANRRRRRARRRRFSYSDLERSGFCGRSSTRPCWSKLRWR